MYINPIAKARFENQKAIYKEENEKLKERWEKERAAEKKAARIKENDLIGAQYAQNGTRSYRSSSQEYGYGNYGNKAEDDEDVFEKIGRDYEENARKEREIEEKRWEGFGDFFAKEGGVAGQRQAPGFNYGGKESEHSGRSRSDNMALAMGVEQELLDKIASEAKEKKGKDIFTEGIESSVWSTSAGLTELADMFIGKPLQSLGWEDNFISEWNEYYQDRAEEKHQDLMDAAARTGKGKTAETAAILVEMLGEAGIDALLGMVTGGASAAAKLGSKGGKVLKYADDVGDLAKRKYAGAYEKIDDVLFSPMDSANSNTNKKFREALNSRNTNDIIITDEQIGKKTGKHTKEYNLNPSKEEDRIKLLNIIDDVINNADEVVIGDNWRHQVGHPIYYIKGEDVVVVMENDKKFVTILKGGITNERVKKARGR
ncbi:MAG: hypothetical protein E7489_04500 [Ruminococcaceae bacterium]|nr:hypothetical protein [Oscillospiraceae bacterium]